MIGMGAIILTGAVIGNNCVIGAGAVVKENDIIPDDCVAVGIPPSRRIRMTLQKMNRLIWSCPKKLFPNLSDIFVALSTYM